MLLSLLSSMLGCMDAQGVLAQKKNHTARCSITEIKYIVNDISCMTDGLTSARLSSAELSLQSVSSLVFSAERPALWRAKYTFSILSLAFIYKHTYEAIRYRTAEGRNQASEHTNTPACDPNTPPLWPLSCCLQQRSWHSFPLQLPASWSHSAPSAVNCTERKRYKRRGGEKNDNKAAHSWFSGEGTCPVLCWFSAPVVSSCLLVQTVSSC